VVTLRNKEAWRKAANCALLAGQVTDERTRSALITLRNSWINMANNSEIVGAVDANAVLEISLSVD
jgi:hypothetical protein